jgi:hypothetical protein
VQRGGRRNAGDGGRPGEVAGQQDSARRQLVGGQAGREPGDQVGAWLTGHQGARLRGGDPHDHHRDERNGQSRDLGAKLAHRSGGDQSYVVRRHPRATAGRCGHRGVSVILSGSGTTTAAGGALGTCGLIATFHDEARTSNACVSIDCAICAPTHTRGPAP